MPGKIFLSTPSGGSSYTNLFQESANVLAERNGTSAQSLYVYNTYTDASNYERGVFDWTTSANTLTIGSKAAGTGTQRAVFFDASSYQWLIGGASAVQLASGSLNPNTDGGYNLGASGKAWNRLYCKIIDTTSAVNVTSTSASGWSMLTFTDNSTNAKLYFGYGNASAPSLAGLAFAQTNGVDFAVYSSAAELFRFNAGGGVLTPKTIVASGTTGAQTINKMAGSVNFAAAATSLVVTNSLVTTNSIVVCQLATADATAVLGAVVKAAGSFTINMKTAPTAETRVDFYVATT